MKKLTNKKSNSITVEQSKLTLIKRIVEVAFEGCIEAINIEIGSEKITKNTTKSLLYIEGLTRAKDIINELKTTLRAYSQ